MNLHWCLGENTEKKPPILYIKGQLSGYMVGMTILPLLLNPAHILDVKHVMFNEFIKEQIKV